MSPPLATIIVISFNSARWVARQRAALDAQTERRWRLIVLDNASREDERPHLRDLPSDSTIVQSAVNLGFAEGNNAAARDADTPYLVFLNPDAFPEPDWLEKLIAAAEANPSAGAIGSLQLKAGAPDVLDGAGDVLHVSGMGYRGGYGHGRGSATQTLAEPFSACAAAMLVRRDAFETVGGFDPRYFCFFEDIDLCFRLRLGGWRILQAPDAVVTHVGGGTTNARSAFAEFHGARNRLWTFVKCMPAALFWPMLPLHLLLSATAATISGLRSGHFAAWRGVAAGMSGVTPFWRGRRDIQRARSASTRDIARALAWSPDVLISRRIVLRRP
ncbi:MAG: glycosyltransferase family 2 protein [Caulobacterales bacterium]|nr:glycosyltransferase family 2 protein [Caulobacterales bacterium]